MKKEWPQWYKIARLKDGEILGSIHQQPVKCGKRSCKCRSGKLSDMHSAYYRYWRDDKGKLQKAYVKKTDVHRVIAGIAQRKARLKAERKKRDLHMRRGKGKGKNAHEWYIKNKGENSFYNSPKGLDNLADLIDRILRTK